MLLRGRRDVKLRATYERIVTATRAVHRQAKFRGALFPRISDQRSLSTTLSASSVARLVHVRRVVFCEFDGELNTSSNTSITRRRSQITSRCLLAQKNRRENKNGHIHSSEIYIALQRFEALGGELHEHIRSMRDRGRDCVALR